MRDLATRDGNANHHESLRSSHRSKRGIDRWDYNRLAAIEYRRALRAVLTARSETRLRTF